MIYNLHYIDTLINNINNKTLIISLILINKTP